MSLGIKGRFYLVVLPLVCGVTASVYADIPDGHLANELLFDGTRINVTNALLNTSDQPMIAATDVLPREDTGLDANDASALPDDEASQQAQSLPAGPSSATLFLWAMASFGAVRSGRSGHGHHLRDFPTWWHLDAPKYVGRSVAVNPHAIDSRPLVAFEVPAAPKPFRPKPRLLRRAVRTLHPQWSVTRQGGRAPPCRPLLSNMPPR